MGKCIAPPLDRERRLPTGSERAYSKPNPKMNMITLRGARLMLAAFALPLLAIPAAAAATAFSKIVVFGDSVSDRGNLVQFTHGVFPNVPNYAYGRQSNGPVWVEYLASRLSMAGKIQNYAVVGAMTKPAPGFPTGNVWSDTFTGLEGTDIATQVLDYIGDSRGKADPAALHILQGGANDLPRIANPLVLVTNLVESFVALQTAGAKHIVVVSLPDIGKTPRVILGERFGVLPAGSTVQYSAATAQLNGYLAYLIAMAKAPDVTVTLADMWGFVNEVAAHPAVYGMVETQLFFLGFGGSANPATWLFWDDLHPTTRGHQIFAEAAIDSLVKTYSPRQGQGDGKGVVNSLRGLVPQPAPKN